MPRRPIRPVRFSIDCDLMVAADFDQATLARLLTQLATAGLMGMITLIRNVELDGVSASAEISEPDPRVQMLRPPPDERIGKAIRELESGLETLRLVMGRDLSLTPLPHNPPRDGQPIPTTAA